MLFFFGRGLCFYNSRCFVILKLRDQYIKLSRISWLNSGGSVLSGGLCSDFCNSLCYVLYWFPEIVININVLELLVWVHPSFINSIFVWLISNMTVFYCTPLHGNEVNRLYQMWPRSLYCIRHPSALPLVP